MRRARYSTASAQPGILNTTTKPMTKKDSRDQGEIALLAYYAWEKDGRPEGQALDYWLEAEAQLKATRHLLIRELRTKQEVATRIDLSIQETAGFQPQLPSRRLSRESLLLHATRL